jgi:hypothetical protein
LRSWSVERVKRSANSVVHTIAREAILYVINMVLVEETLNCICGIVGREFYVPSRFDEFSIKVLTFVKT